MTTSPAYTLLYGSQKHLFHGVYNTRFEVDDNIGEGIHIHYKNCRFDFSIRDFLLFASMIEKANNRIREIYNDDGKRK